MNITMVRHGKSLWDENKPVTCLEFKNWVENYDEHGVCEEESYPPETLQKVAGAKLIITSDLKRAVESAKFLHPKLPANSDRLFREAELPISSVRWLSRITLKPNVWAVILRSLWFCGFSAGCESLKEAKLRAEMAAANLEKYAQEHNDVVLVGHGIFNRLIGKELMKKGWSRNDKPRSEHWSATTFSYGK